ncbi:YopB/SseC family type III secretion system translocon subunit [Proteus sp. G2672]|uniref:type III secretion system translocon subunit SctE n=1 Tax=Proteus sp. G2672 TaxID=2698884 RepID=UPI001376E1A4|nr:type III secretion system translocon subunit SctE [Proteus sp. G2672]NBL77640.1 YopB/SseC family type III secretion system translocon subunit [Proteus sp. G2672]
MNGKVNNDIIYERKVSTFSPSKEVEKVNKENVKQAQIINTVTNEKLINEVILKDKNNFEYPILRVPIEQEKSSKKIDTKSDLNFNIKAASEQEYQTQLYPQKKEKEDVLNSPIEANRKEEILANQKHLYDDSHYIVKNKNTFSIDSTKTKTKTKTKTETEIQLLYTESNKSKISSSKRTNYYLFLQLSYQNLINKSILDKLKNIDNLDYYLDKLDKLSQGFNGLKNDCQFILDDVNKYKEAYTDYWMEIYNQIKINKFKNKKEIIIFLKNNNIPDAVVSKLLAKKINSREEMAVFLEDNFPFMRLPKSTKNYTLDDIYKLYNNLANFLDEAFKYIPNVSLSNDKINSITSHRDELNSLINKKHDESINSRLDSAQDIYNKLTKLQSKIELEVASHALTGMALLTFLLAKLRELTLRVTLQRVQGEQKIFDDIQEVTTKSLKQKIEDQKTQLEKKRETDFWAGIGLKILGALLTLIAGAASIFTAGASLALLGVAVVMMVASVSLMVADEIYQAITHKSFMEEAMAPVTKAVSELVDKLADVISDIIEAYIDASMSAILSKAGLGKEAIEKIIKESKNKMKEKIRMAVKIVITIGLLVGGVALSCVAGPVANAVTNVAKKIFTEQTKMILKKILNDYLEAMLGKMVKEIIMETLKDIIKSITKLLTKDLAKFGLNTLNKMLLISRLITAAVSSIINIYTALITDAIIRAVADSKKLQVILDMIQALIERIMDSYHEQVDTLTEMLQSMSDNLSASNKTRAIIVKNMNI